MYTNLYTNIVHDHYTNVYIKGTVAQDFLPQVFLVDLLYSIWGPDFEAKKVLDLSSVTGEVIEIFRGFPAARIQDSRCSLQWQF